MGHRAYIVERIHWYLEHGRSFQGVLMSNAFHVDESPDQQLETERGASMVEYALLVVLIAIVGFLAVANFGTNLSDAFSTIAGSLSN
jgi:pilus assembly protein Flp/PilA